MRPTGQGIGPRWFVMRRRPHTRTSFATALRHGPCHARSRGRRATLFASQPAAAVLVRWFALVTVSRCALRAIAQRFAASKAFRHSGSRHPSTGAYRMARWMRCIGVRPRVACFRRGAIRPAGVSSGVMERVRTTEAARLAQAKKRSRFLGLNPLGTPQAPKNKRGEFFGLGKETRTPRLQRRAALRTHATGSASRAPAGLAFSNFGGVAKMPCA
jgi:hypothetical protein